MKLQTLRRGGVATIAVLALSGGLAACGSSSNNAADNTAGTTSGSSSAATSGDSSSSGSTDLASQVFGPACSALPTSGDGSLTGMVTDPVATAASTNPLLTTLTAAVGAAGLGDTLNGAPALTVFAPYDDAFKAIPSKTLNTLLAGAKKDGPKSALAQILEHHVLAANDDPSAVVGTQKTLDGDSLKISGDPQSGMTVSDGTVTAKVLCGNIPTKNATVYVIDKVLTGAKTS